MNPDILLLVAFAAGYFVSIFMGDWFIKPIRDKMHEGYDRPGKSHDWRPRAIGYLERLLYTSSILADSPSFIAIWLALKVAGQWDRWKLDVGEGASKGTHKARATYAAYLIGNGVSLLYGAVGAFVTLQLQEPRWWFAVVVIVVLMILNIAYYLYIKRHAESYARHEIAKDG